MFKYILTVFIVLAATASCKKFVELTPPDTALVASKVFDLDISATSAVTAILGEVAGYNAFSGGYSGISVVSGLMSDELTTVSQQLTYIQVFSNTLLSDNPIITDIWTRAYQHVYRTNAIIEGVQRSTALSAAARSQVLGEAYFLRAFMYFYLTNLYGPLPLITSTNYEENRQASRQPATAILKQIVEDLKLAQELLGTQYADNNNKSTTARIRPNKWAATALLARALLFQKDWAKAETEAGSVIGQGGTYILDANLNNVFKPAAQEAIWHLPPGVYSTGQTLYAIDGYHFGVQLLKSYGLPPQSFGYDYSNYMNDSLGAAFEPNDKRKLNWVDSLVVSGKKYYMPYKYKNGSNTTTGTADYLVVLRLAEQYLIRAEARLQQNNLSGAIQDINTIRARAGLPATTAATPAQVMAAIEQERRLELFTEWGHRWFDLKRWPATGNPAVSRAEELMAVLTPKKGGVWSGNWLVMPIPRNEILNGPNMIQNTGYN
jgi:hypothetical protein